MRAASVYYSGMFNSEAVILPEEVTYKKNVPSDTPFLQELNSFMLEEDMLTSEIVADGQKYKNGDLIVLDVEDCDTLKVGLLQSILVRRDKAYFVCKVYTCTRNWLQFFESKTCEEVCSFVDSRKIADFKPLIKRGSSLKFNFVLHHRISFSYK